MNLHFVYAGHPKNTEKFAPFTITRNLFNFLSTKFDKIFYYDWCFGGKIRPVGRDDIILGHPNYPLSTATRQLFKKPCRAKFLIFPFHHSMPQVNFPFDDIVKQADKIFSITGPYWYDTIDKTKFAHWREKMVRVDMAINHKDFPHTKKSFNPPGKRTFYYLGSDIPEKGLDFLATVLAKSPMYTLHLYGNIDAAHPVARLPNTKNHGWVSTSPAWAKNLAKIADVFLSPGRSDANPTTLLEALCWGFPAACTQQSGYYSGERGDNMFFGLTYGDPHTSVQTLHQLNAMDESDLVQHALEARKKVVERHNWQRFCDVVWTTLQEYM